METKNKIIEATYGLFAEKGMEFSLNAVAEIVGIKKASIYAHFESKEILLYELFNKEIDEYFAVIECHSTDLKDLFLGILNYYCTSRKKLMFWKRLLLFPPDTMGSDIREQIIDLSNKRYSHVKMLIENRISSKYSSDYDLLTVMFISMIHGLLSSEIIYFNHNINAFYEKEWLLIEELLKKRES